jgi:hypothetical protein
MRKLISRAVTGTVLLIAANASPRAWANLLSPLEASALIQSTVSDADVEFLSQLTPLASGHSLAYTSNSTMTSWSGTLSGNFFGSAVNVSYLGDLSGYPSGAVTWTSTGTYGSAAWTGSGAASITDTSATTFQMTLTSALAFGGNTASLDYTIPGTVLPDGTFMIGDASHPEAGSGTVTLNGFSSLTLILFSFRTEGSFQPGSPKTVVFSDINHQSPNGFDLFNNLDLTISIPVPNLFTSGTINVPEPPSVQLLALGLLGLVPLRLLGRRKES